MNILRWNIDAETIYVKNKRTGEIEEAQSDHNGIVRDSEGRSYSAGAYELMGAEGVNYGGSE